MRNSESKDAVRPETKSKEDAEGQTPSILKKPDTPTKEEWEKAYDDTYTLQELVPILCQRKRKRSSSQEQG